MNKMARQFPTDVLKQARSALDALNQIGDGGLAFGDLTTAVFSSEVQRAAEIEAQMTSLENQMTDLRNQRIERLGSLWEMLKRVRAGVKAAFGDDSSQYEMVGGTRLSERKAPTRKVSA
jgi:hypothetical protein